MSKEIQLTKGYVTIVDDDNFEYLSKQKWHAKEGGDLVYACGKVWHKESQSSSNIIESQILEFVP